MAAEPQGFEEGDQLIIEYSGVLVPTLVVIPFSKQHVAAEYIAWYLKHYPYDSDTHIPPGPAGFPDFLIQQGYVKRLEKAFRWNVGDENFHV